MNFNLRRVEKRNNLSLQFNTGRPQPLFIHGPVRGGHAGDGLGLGEELVQYQIDVRDQRILVRLPFDFVRNIFYLI